MPILIYVIKLLKGTMDLLITNSKQL